MPRKLRTLFLEPKTYISAIFTVQSQLIRYLHRDQVEVFVACEAGDASARPPIVVPHTELSAEALTGVIESFVLREGTDYGERDVPF